MAKITWFEGNNGSQNVVRRDTYSNSNRYYIASNLKKEKGQNDEIRSALLEYVPEGSEISVFDNPDGKKNDDWTIIYVKQYKRKILIRHFEENVNNNDYRMEFSRKNGLNGKISRVVIASPPQPQRAIQDYVQDSMVEEAGPFPAKGGQASEFEVSDHHYRMWTPSITPMTSKTVFVNTKMDHIRGGAPDDHASFNITFDEHGVPVKVDYDLQINDYDPIASIFELQGEVAKQVGGLASNSPSPKAQVAAAVAQISGAVCGAMAEGIRQMSETGGRMLFPDAVQSKIFEVCFAVHEAYNEFYDDQHS
jgi:hypothetical protein